MKGECFCTDIKFRITRPTLWCAHCHCSMCQRSHGAGVVTWVGCVEESVVIDDEKGRLEWFRSSEEAERGFCSNCGSSMFFRSGQWPSELHIARAMIAGNLDREPAGHAYYETHVEWMELNDQLPGRQ
jgi:hypothetical protein